jgi:hypothetical protein
MNDDGVTVTEAMEIAQGDDYGGRAMIKHLRATTFDQLAAYEKRLGISPTTSEKLYWLKIKGPADAANPARRSESSIARKVLEISSVL